jgi:hypothetical protein
MMLLDFALVRNHRHKLPSLCKTTKLELSLNTLPFIDDFPSRREPLYSVRQVSGLVGGIN